MRTSAFLGAMVCVVACGKSGTQAQPGAVAGTVLEVSGKVTVAGTALSVGDPVKSDAVVETADDGHVVIELAHNQARWELGPNQKKKPTESLAWNQPKGSGSAAGTEQATSAAGRPAERSAADTATTAPDRGGPPPAQAAQPEAARPQAQPQAPEPTTGGPGAAALPPPPPPPPPTTTPEGGSTRSPTPPPMKAKSKGGSVAVEREDQADGLVGAASDSPKASMTAQNPDVNALKTAFAQCTKDTLTVSVTVKAHTATVTFSGAIDEGVKACINRASGMVKLARETGSFSLTIN